MTAFHLKNWSLSSLLKAFQRRSTFVPIQKQTLLLCWSSFCWWCFVKPKIAYNQCLGRVSKQTPVLPVWSRPAVAVLPGVC